MSKRFIISIITLLVIAVIAGAAILLAKGYTFSSKEKRLVGTGIITVSSEPDSASVFLDGHLTTATNATISSLSPKTYTVRVVKEGLIPWERTVEVKEGLVTELKITLFPSLPTIYPLTFSGVVNPALSPDGSKLGFVVPSGKKAGVWVWTMSRNQPISFARSSEPHQVVTAQVADFSKATLKWSPDSKQILATFTNSNYLLDSDNLNNDPKDITPTLEATLKGWDDDTSAKDTARIDNIKNIKLRQIASSSARLDADIESQRASLKWSPDETKFMALQAKNMKVYDLVDGKEYLLPSAKSHLWLPDSRHIILIEDQNISVADFDGTNKDVIYAGKFEDSFIFPWPDSSRLVIISSFPTPTASEPNLYGINLR